MFSCLSVFQQVGIDIGYIESIIDSKDHNLLEQVPRHGEHGACEYQSHSFKNPCEQFKRTDWLKIATIGPK